jgi:hypothetical protein
MSKYLDKRCYAYGLKSEIKNGGTLSLPILSKKQFSYNKYVKFIKKLGWAANINGMLRDYR